MSNEAASKPLLEHLEKLIPFLAIARAGSIQAASRKLKLSQPTLTRTVQVLEDALGTALFKRSRRGVALTDAGRIVLRYTERLVEQSEALWRELGHGAPAALTIGTHEALASVVWPPLVRALAQRTPPLRLDLITSLSASDLLRRLRDGEADLIMAVELPDAPGVTRRRLLPSIWRFYTAPEWIDARSDPPTSARGKRRTAAHAVSRADAEAAPLLYMPNAVAGGGTTLTDALRALGFETSPRIRVQSLESALTLAVAGAGIALLPSFFADLYVDDGKLAPVSIAGVPAQGIGGHYIYLAHAQDRAADPSIAATARAIIQVCTDLSGNPTE